MTYKLSSTWSCQWLNGSSSFLNMCTVWRLISLDKLYSYYKTKLGLKLKTFYEEFFNWTRWPSFSKITKNIKALDPFLGILEYISLVKLGNDDFHSFCKQAYAIYKLRMKCVDRFAFKKEGWTMVFSKVRSPTTDCNDCRTHITKQSWRLKLKTFLEKRFN